MNARIEQLPMRQDSAPAANFSSQGLLMDFDKINAMQTLAEAMAKAQIAVPQHFRGKPGDCLAVVMQAAQWGMNPFAVAQKTHVVNGALGYEAQLVNAVVQASGAIVGRFHYEYRDDGDAVECRVGAILAGENDITFGEWLSAKSVTTKNSPLWKTNPKQQLGYLQIKNWARAYTPGAILGVYSTDELEERDVTAEGETIGADRASRTESIKAKLIGNTPAGEVLPTVTLASVSASFAKAGDLDALNAAAAAAKGLPAEDQKALRAAYKTRKHQIEDEQAQQQQPGHDADDQALQDLETRNADTGPGVTFESVAEAIAHAETDDALQTAADLIGSVPDAGDREVLGKRYKDKRDELGV